MTRLRRRHVHVAADQIAPGVIGYTVLGAAESFERSVGFDFPRVNDNLPLGDPEPHASHRTERRGA